MIYKYGNSDGGKWFSEIYKPEEHDPQIQKLIDAGWEKNTTIESQLKLPPGTVANYKKRISVLWK
jgi:hypothetical protein